MIIVLADKGNVACAAESHTIKSTFGGTNMIRTANPALNERAFRSARSSSTTEVMTLDGAVNKTAFSIILTIAAGYWSWTNPEMIRFYLPLMLLTLGIFIALYFKKEWAPFLTPAYAVAEGLMLGSISLMFEMRFPGIAFQAISYTFGALAALLLAYKSGWIKATENFKLGVFAATGAIAIVYLLNMILSLFGMPMSFLHNSSPLSIGISMVVVVVAALNLVLDFDFIENAAASRNTPKYMEWYAAFGLLVTLIWLYLEILRLLSKLNSRE